MKFKELKSRVATLSLGTGSNYRVERNTGSTIIMNLFGLYQISETTVGSVREANDIGIIPEHDRLALQKLAYKYSRTPLDERRDEPKFQVRMMYGDSKSYLNFLKEDFNGQTSGSLIIADCLDTSALQTTFTESLYKKLQ
ncbi:MAG: hypothetical protein DUD35_05520 [Lactobacillus sp.]|jgi:hypothetical protein|nr:MAG: hypothetical protein DUD35_05520 [Lactobacillus sp.]